MEEQKLEGGRISGAVRVGDTVRKRAGKATAAVHALLRYLESAGFADVPRVLGFDEQEREILTFVAGDTVGDTWPWPEWVFADETLVQVGQWLRAFHDLTRRFTPSVDAVWAVGPPWREGMVIAHNDAAPYNAVWRDGKLAGFVDFDLAAPSTVELDLAFSALSWVPLHSGKTLGAAGSTDLAVRRRRLRLLLDSYGYRGDRVAFGATIAQRARLNAGGIRQLAASGDPIYVSLLPTAGDLEYTAAEIEALPGTFWAWP